MNKGTRTELEKIATEQYERLLKAEKDVDAQRKMLRQDKQRKLEEELDNKKRQKIEKRQERSKEMKAIVPTKPLMHRSKKPDVKRTDEKMIRKMNQEEIDHLRYVEGNADMLN